MSFPAGDYDSWFRLLLAASIKASLILAAGFAVTWLLRRRSASLRHLIWTVALLGSLAMPVLTGIIPGWRVAALDGVTGLWPGARNAAAGPEASSLSAMEVQAGTMTPARTKTGGVLFFIWVGGLLADWMGLLAGAVQLRWFAARAKPLTSPRWTDLLASLSRAAGVRRPVRLMQSHIVTMPVTWGVLEPRVLLPKGADFWTADRARIVLQHELAHVRRRDWLVQVLAEAGRCLYWFHPLVWLGCSRLRAESEQACDDAVLNAGVDAPEYAEHLLDLARNLRSPRWAWPTLAMARPSNLERRFFTMLNPCLNRRSVTKRAAVLTILATLCVVVPLAALRTPAQSLSGRFSGAVYDASGGVIQNATVIVANPQKRTKDMTTTNAVGSFEFSGLPAGEYSLEVLQPGFKRYVSSPIALQANQDRYEKVTLEIGEVSERIDVTAKSPAAAVTPVAATPERVRVGGSIQQTRLVQIARPAYPEPAKSMGVQGAVLLEAVIGTDGRLMSLRVMNSQIDPDLAKAAVEAVSQWQYQPTLLNGAPVEVITRITVNFQLSK